MRLFTHPIVAMSLAYLLGCLSVFALTETDEALLCDNGSLVTVANARSSEYDEGIREVGCVRKSDSSPNGPILTWSGKNLIAVGQWIAGLRDGQSIVWYPNGVVRSVTTFSGGTEIGPLWAFASDGSPIYYSGRADSTGARRVIEFYRDGTKHRAYSTVDEKLANTYEIWSERGEILVRGVFLTGNRVGNWDCRIDATSDFQRFSLPAGSPANASVPAELMKCLNVHSELTIPSKTAEPRLVQQANS